MNTLYLRDCLCVLKDNIKDETVDLIYIDPPFIMAGIFKLFVVISFLITLPVQVHALTPAQVFDKIKDSVVVVKTHDAQGKVKGQGSGVLISSDKIATNCHVVKEGASFQVGRGKQLVSATLYAEDGDKDICILDAKGITGKPTQIGKAAGLKVGDPVYAVGAPKGLELSLSDGIVSQLRGGPPPLIQTTAAISPGSSGGGLFDAEGRLIGLTSLYIEGGQSLNFAMPAEWIEQVKPGRKSTTEVRSQTEWLKRAIALEQKSDWQRMSDWCQKWTKSEPQNANAWSGLGYAYAGLRRYEDAIDAYRQAIRINPNNGNTWAGLGWAYFSLRRYDNAIEAYRQAVRIDPQDAGTWFNLGGAYQILRRYENAIEAYRQAVRIDPQDAGTWFNLGLVYLASGNRSAALDVVQQLQRLDPKQAEDLFNLIVPR